MLRLRHFQKELFILLITFGAYLPALGNGFVWDDDAWLMNNPTVHGLKGLHDLWFHITALQQYFPITGTVFWIEYHLWGFHPLGYHVVNVLLHASNAVLLGALLQRLRVPGAWIAAALFAVHPVMTESVAWITELKNTLSTLFYLGSAMAYAHFEDFDDPERRRNWSWFAISLALFACALLTKSITCTLPVALGIVIWWKRPAIRLRDFLPLLPFLALAIPMGLVTRWLELHHVGATGEPWNLTFLQRCGVAGRAVWFYLFKLISPARLTFIYPRWQFADARLLFWGAAVLVILAALWLGRPKIGKAPFAVAAFFIVSLGPLLGFSNGYAFQFSFVADHWQYLASIGIFAAAGAFVATLPVSRTARFIGSGVMILLLGLLTWNQCFAYKNIESLWRDTLSKNPNCWLAHNNLGVDMRDHARFAEAAEHFRAAIRLKPGYFEAEDNLGEALLGEGKLEEASEHIDRSLAISAGYIPAHWDKALVLARQRKLDEAYAIVREGLQQPKINLEGLNNFAWLLATWPDPAVLDPSGAEELARRCCELSGYSNASFVDTLAAALASEGKFDEARPLAEKALALARDANLSMLAGEIERRLALYRFGKPYRQEIPGTSY